MSKSGGKTEWIRRRYKLNRLLWQNFQFFMETCTPAAVQNIRPLRNKYIMTVLVFISYVLTFALLCYFGWKNSYETQYLVPLDEATSTSSQQCDVQTRSVSDYNFMIDTNGQYEGSLDFYYTRALYQLEFNNAVFTRNEYQSFMENIRLQVDELGAKATENSLSLNIIQMYTYIQVKSLSPNAGLGNVNDQQAQLFYFVADIGDIFQPSNSPWFYIRNKDYECNIPWNAYFSQGSYDFGVTFNASEYGNIIQCQDILTVKGWTYGVPTEGSLSMNTLTNARYDARTFMVAIAMNLNYYNNDTCHGSIDNCLQITSKPYSVNVSGVPVPVYYYVDIRFKGMAAVPCVTIPTSLSDFKLSCWIEFQDFTGLPVLNNLPNYAHHESQSEYWENRCDCSINGHSSYCSGFFFSLSLIIYNTYGDSDLTAFYNLLTKYSQGNYDHLFEDAYNATLPPTAKMDNQSENFEFCYDEETGMSCAVATFFTANYLHVTNDYQRGVYNGSCADIFSVDDSAWDTILSNTPYDFDENYASCHKTSSSAFIDSSGIALANTFTLVPLAATFVASMYFLYLLFTTPQGEHTTSNYNAKEGTFYTTDQKRVVQMVADLILRELYVRKYGKSTEIDVSDNVTIRSLVDVLEKEMSHQYSTKSYQMDSTVEKFGYVKDIDHDRSIRENGFVSNPIEMSTVQDVKGNGISGSSSSDHQNDSCVVSNGNGDVEGVVPGFKL